MSSTSASNQQQQQGASASTPSFGVEEPGFYGYHPWSPPPPQPPPAGAQGPPSPPRAQGPAPPPQGPPPPYNPPVVVEPPTVQVHRNDDGDIVTRIAMDERAWMARIQFYRVGRIDPDVSMVIS